MDLRRLRVMAVVVPAVWLLAYEAARHFVLQPILGERGPHLSEHLISIGILVVAASGFSFFVFHLLGLQHRRLEAVNEAAFAVTSDLSLEPVLGRVAELAAGVADVPYASVEVDGDPPVAVATGRQPESGARVKLPITVRGRPVGTLVLAASARRFPFRDLRALETFAQHAGIAIENARLFGQVQQLVAARERARIGMDLHDGVIQELYALRLKVEDAADLVGPVPREASVELQEVQAGLGTVIDEIRTYVYGLDDGDGAVELAPVLKHLVAEYPGGGPVIELVVEGDTRMPGVRATKVLHVTREALTNAVRHAAASRVRVRAVVRNDLLNIRVEDNGCGFDPNRERVGLGIADMRKRAASCGGLLELDAGRGRGTCVSLTLPLNGNAP